MDSLDLTGDAPTTTAQDSGAADDVHAYDLDSGTYVARVRAESEADEDGQFSLWSAPITVLPDDVAPTMTNADLTVDGGDRSRARHR